MKALILLLVSGSLAAGVFIAGKQAGHDDIPPLLILFWQLSGGALVIWMVSLATRSYPAWNTQHIRYYLIGGLLGISIPYILAFNVLKQLQVGTVGLLTALSPIVTYIIARLLRMEQGHPLRLLGLCIGLGGVLLLVTPQQGGDIKTGRLKQLLVGYQPPEVSIYAVYHERRFLSPKIRAFIDFFKHRLSDPPYWD